MQISWHCMRPALNIVRRFPALLPRLLLRPSLASAFLRPPTLPVKCKPQDSCDSFCSSGRKQPQSLFDAPQNIGFNVPYPGPEPRREPWHWRRKCAFPQFPFQISHIRGEASLLLSLSRLSSPEARRCPSHWRRAMPWTQAKPGRACRSCLHHRPQFPAFATLQRSRAFHLQ